MKKKENSPLFNVTNDAELEALAKAYIQAAHKRQFTMTQTTQLICQIWKEEIAQKEKSIVLTPPKETTEQIIFREKTEKFINHFPDFVQPYGGPLSQADMENNAKYAVEVICGFYKMLLEEDNIKSSSLIEFVSKYLKQISDTPEYSSATKVKSFKDYIFMKLEYLIFKVEGFSGIGCLHKTDLSYLPTLSRKKVCTSDELRTIKFISEPYEKMMEYDTRKNTTLTKLFQLIWVIETFF